MPAHAVAAGACASTTSTPRVRATTPPVPSSPRARAMVLCGTAKSSARASASRATTTRSPRCARAAPCSPAPARAPTSRARRAAPRANASIREPAAKPRRAAGADVAWRMRVDDAVVEFSDRVQGPQRQSVADDVGDFVVRRRDGLYAYQLAIVVDDGDDAITDVVRGADLLASTSRQILLQRALELPTPAYLHVPVAVDARGDKLSKQTHARALDAADPVGALLAAWQFLGQPPAEAVPRSPAQFWLHACSAWTPSRIPALAALPCPASFA